MKQRKKMTGGSKRESPVVVLEHKEKLGIQLGCDIFALLSELFFERDLFIKFVQVALTPASHFHQVNA